MTRARGTLAGTSLLAATAAATAWIAMSAWRGLAESPGGFLNPLMLLAIVVAAVGTAARWWRWPGPAVFVTQVVVSGMLASLFLCGSPVPVGAAWTELRDAISQAVESATLYPAPVGDEVPSIDPLLILAGLASLLLVDLLACTLHRVSLTGLPLLAIYAIPVGVIDGTITWWVFVATAAGFLTMLFLQESDQVTRWGRPLGEDAETGDPIAFGAGAHAVRGTASAIGGAATALALVVPVLIPTTGLSVFDFGPGNGSGDEIRIDNPVTDLVRDLKRGEDVPLVEVTTTDPDPSYLRILTLTRFTDASWSPGNRDVPSDNLADGQLAPPQGVAPDVGRQEFPYDVTVLPSFDSRWLPTQPPISRIDATGDWRYDERTYDFLAGEDGLSTSGMRYTMTAVDLDLTADRLARAGIAKGTVSDLFTDLPDDLPAMVEDLAEDVTRTAATPYEKAVALQDFFREDGGFKYSLDRAEGSGSDALVDFLSEQPGGRIGYCEQFASAMAVMARMVGIPARIGVGFLSPDSTGPNTYEYSAHDMHAWPELYIDGGGWVRFEPTPSARVADVPDYTEPQSAADDDPSESAGPTPTESATAPSARPRETLDEAAGADSGNGADSGFPWLRTVGATITVLLLLAGLLLPGTLRRRRRTERLATGATEPIWAELHDTAVDLAITWPRARSPRATRDGLVEHLGAPVGSTTDERPAHGPEIAPEAVDALDRIVLALELERYARPGSRPVTADGQSGLRADGATCVAALAGGASRNARRRARWWPRSVVSLRRRRVRSTGPTVEARYGGVVDHVGERPTA